MSLDELWGHESLMATDQDPAVDQEFAQLTDDAWEDPQAPGQEDPTD